MEAPGHVPSVPSPKSGTANLIQGQDKSRRLGVGPDAVDDYVVIECFNVLSALHSAMLSPPLSPFN